jgi:hypothetical protein
MMWGRRRKAVAMSEEFDDVTYAFAELLSKLQSANDADKQAAITFAIER